MAYQKIAKLIPKLKLQTILQKQDLIIIIVVLVLEPKDPLQGLQPFIYSILVMVRSYLGFYQKPFSFSSHLKPLFLLLGGKSLNQGHSMFKFSQPRSRMNGGGGGWQTHGGRGNKWGTL